MQREDDRTNKSGSRQRWRYAVGTSTWHWSAWSEKTGGSWRVRCLHCPSLVSVLWRCCTPFDEIVEVVLLEC